MILKIFIFLLQIQSIDIRKYHLNQYMKQFFSFDPEKNPFIKALEELEDGSAKEIEIFKIFGRDFMKIKSLF